MNRRAVVRDVVRRKLLLAVFLLVHLEEEFLFEQLDSSQREDERLMLQHAVHVQPYNQHNSHLLTQCYLVPYLEQVTVHGCPTYRHEIQSR